MLKPRGYGKKESTLAPAIIILNILIAAVVLLLVFFIYNYVTSDDDPNNRAGNGRYSAAGGMQNLANSDNYDNYDNPENGQNLPEEELTPYVTTISEETATVSMTKASTTPPAAQGNINAFVPGAYDGDFFKNDLFIGDSIMTGIHLYGFIPAENVFAKVGVNPESVKETQINNQTAIEKAAQMKPERIYVMLGSNGISFMTGSGMVADMEDFIAELAAAVPNSEIIILTIPPVTDEYENSHPDTTESINNYNSLLKASALRNHHLIIDSAAILKNSSGHLADDYAEADGIHFKAAAYRTILSLVQFTIENS